LANATSTEVTFSQEYEAVPKIAATAKKPIALGVTEQTTKGFRVYITEPLTEDLAFDWIALAVKDQTQPTNNIVLGCLDQTALNYNPSANTEDGSCQYPAPPSSGGDGSITTKPPAEEPVVTTPPEETPPPTEEPIVIETPVTTPTEPTPDITPTVDNSQPTTDSVTEASPTVSETTPSGDQWTVVKSSTDQ
jgi:hypothetical protein